MNYCFIDSNGEKSKVYSPGLMAEIDGNLADDIFINYAGEIAAKIGEQIKIISDYPYYNKLIKAGYFVYKDYDRERVEDPDMGVELRKELFIRVMEKLYDTLKDLPDFEDLSYDHEYRFSYSSCKYTIRLDSVSAMVNKNMDRKDNNLKYYPYDKNVDKYGCLYLRIYGQNTSEDSDDTKNRRYASKIVKKTLSKMGEYHFKDLPIRTRIVYNKQ